MLVDINLLPERERDRPASIVAAIGILLLAAIVWALFAYLASGFNEQQADLAAQTVQVQTEQALLREKIEAVQGMNEEQQLKATVEWAESYQFDTLPLLAELVSKLPARGYFENFTYTGMDVATLTVQFDSAREAAYYLAQLKTSSLLTSAKLDSVAQEALAIETAEDGTVVIDEDAMIENPRYHATYTLVFVDGRLPALTPEGEIIVEKPVTETPVEEVPPTDVDVNVEVEQQAPEAPIEEPAPADETAGDGQ